MDSAKLRGWWFEKQGLDRRWVGSSPREILARAGWARSVGGANPYLTVFARSEHRRPKIDADAQTTEIHELPCARGCTYVLPQDDFSLGLRVGRGFSEEAAMQTAVKFLGVTEAEVQNLCLKVLEALEDKALDPKEIKAAVGDSARHLGDEGKKRGQTTTLPLALGRLQQSGQIRRVPVEGRLDRQRYKYVLWPDSPKAEAEIGQEEAFGKLAQHYFEWIGPASVANFQWFSGLGVRAAKTAIESLELVPVEDGSDLLIFASEVHAFHRFERPETAQIALVSGLDSLMLLRRDVASFLDASDRERRMPGEKGILKSVGSVMDLSNNALIDRGRLIGLWEFDPEEGKIVAYTFEPRSEAVEAEIARTEAFIRDDLGDCRTFSLDSPESRRPILEALRSLSTQNP